MQDDAEWIPCFEKAVVLATGSALRTLFAKVVMYSGVVNPNHIWTQFQQQFCDDLRHLLLRSNIEIPEDMPTLQYDYGLHLLTKIFIQAAKSLLDYGLRIPAQDWESLIHHNPLISSELDYDKDEKKR